MGLNFSGIILSGGKSTRMGENKAFIEIEGIPIIHRIHSLFQRLFEEVIIVTDQKKIFQELNAEVYEDLIPNRGVLGGLYTGLFFSSFPFSFCVACDMPFLKESVIKFLIENIDSYDVVVPKTQDGLQPLHAIYSKNCLEPVKKIIDEGKFRIIDLYWMVKVKIVEEQELSPFDPMRESFVNVNTPRELFLIKEKKRPL